jgi:hypothetical protein
MALLVLLIFGGVTAVVYPDASSVITLPNGGKYRFSSMTYGTNHVHGPFGARLVNQLPAAASGFLTNALGKHLGKLQSLHSSEPSLCIWFDPVGTGSGTTNSQYFDFTAWLANQAGVVAGTRYFGGASPGQPFGVLFWVVPRRASVLELVIFPNSRSQPVGEPVSEICRVRLPNLLHGRFPQWRPDTSFPAVKVAGDVEVHLDGFLSGVTHPDTYHTNGYYADAYRAARPGELAESAFNVSFKSAGEAKGYWVMNWAELSDATGNHIYLDTQYLYDYRYQNPFRGTLWPDEGAWRLKLELKHPAPLLNLRAGSGRQKFVPEDFGLRPEELLTFSNVPVLAPGATNTLWFTNTIGGSRIIMQEYVSESGGGSGILTFNLPKFHAECAQGSDGIAVDFVEATSTQGERLETGAKLMINGQPTPRAGDYVYTALLNPATNGPTVNITWLVQKTRPVEFLFKPPLP